MFHKHCLLYVSWFKRGSHLIISHVPLAFMPLQFLTFWKPENFNVSTLTSTGIIFLPFCQELLKIRNGLLERVKGGDEADTLGIDILGCEALG